ncbi:hypothetical protein ACSDQ9_09155 [Aestuariimicrobium soli]|uniref:hypothetical protein n=1 Tax=Aestuariimicrobium soli TaxID=2035834 RepID=UPI003EB8EBAA
MIEGMEVNMADAAQVRREYMVTKDDGSEWALQFTNRGVRWTPAERDAPETPQPDRPPVAPQFPFGPVQTIAAVADAAGHLSMAWETRQARLREEAAHEESRRTQWLSEMIGRWGEVHAQSDRLDLMVSEYLAREATSMMEAIVANKRIALPQSMLYDLVSIQEVHRSYRRTMLAQFTALESSELDLRGSFERVLPGHRLNLDFVRAIAADPEQEWVQRVSERSAADFDSDFAPQFRDPAAFQKRLIITTDVAVPGAPLRQDRFADRFLTLFRVTLPNLLPTDYKAEATEKRDLYRELALFPAEVARSKALTAAWLATDQVIAAAHGTSGVDVSVHDGRLQLSLGRGASVAAITQ